MFRIKKYTQHMCFQQLQSTLLFCLECIFILDFVELGMEFIVQMSNEMKEIEKKLNE